MGELCSTCGRDGKVFYVAGGQLCEQCAGELVEAVLGVGVKEVAARLYEWDAIVKAHRLLDGVLYGSSRRMAVPGDCG